MDSMYYRMDAVPIFELAELRILPELCKDSDCSSNKETYLTEFSKFQTSEFCLAFLLTYQDFKGLEGFAYTRSLCAKRGNTGFVTALNNKVSTWLVIITLILWLISISIPFHSLLIIIDDCELWITSENFESWNRPFFRSLAYRAYLMPIRSLFDVNGSRSFQSTDNIE